MLAERMKQLGGSEIRAMFEAAARMKNPINLSLGQPDFDVLSLLKTLQSPQSSPEKTATVSLLEFLSLEVPSKIHSLKKVLGPKQKWRSRVLQADFF